MNKKKEKFVTIKVHKELYESLGELKKALIQQGYNKFPQEFLDFLKEKKFDITKISYGNLIELIINAILFLVK